MQKPILLVAVALALVVAGCGDDEEQSSVGTGTTTTGTTSTVETENPDATLDVSMSEFKFSPAKPRVAPGAVEITATNKGKAEHELVLLKTDADPSKLPKEDGGVSEEDSIGEIPEVPAGQSDSHVFDLEPGTYAMVCNVPGHYDAGMYGTLTVR